jgi:hypothetical protein
MDLQLKGLDNHGFGRQADPFCFSYRNPAHDGAGRNVARLFPAFMALARKPEGGRRGESLRFKAAC